MTNLQGTCLLDLDTANVLKLRNWEDEKPSIFQREPPFSDTPLYITLYSTAHANESLLGKWSCSNGVQRKKLGCQWLSTVVCKKNLHIKRYPVEIVQEMKSTTRRKLCASFHEGLHSSPIDILPWFTIYLKIVFHWTSNHNWSNSVVADDW